MAECEKGADKKVCAVGDQIEERQIEAKEKPPQRGEEASVGTECEKVKESESETATVEEQQKQPSLPTKRRRADDSSIADGKSSYIIDSHRWLWKIPNHSYCNSISYEESEELENRRAILLKELYASIIEEKKCFIKRKAIEPPAPKAGPYLEGELKEKKNVTKNFKNLLQDVPRFDKIIKQMINKKTPSKDL